MQAWFFSEVLGRGVYAPRCKTHTRGFMNEVGIVDHILTPSRWRQLLGVRVLLQTVRRAGHPAARRGWWRADFTRRWRPVSRGMGTVYLVIV